MNIKNQRGRLLPALLAAAVLLLGANVTAYAATGKPLLLGKSNNTTKTTTLASKRGPALSLRTAVTAPPMRVTSPRLVTRLNADQVDGYHASSLMTSSTVYRVPAMSWPEMNPRWSLGRVPTGTYEIGLDLMFTSDGSGRCLVLAGAAERILIGASAPAVRDLMALSGSAVVRISAADSPLVLTCFNEDATLQTWPGTSPQVTLTRIDQLRSATATPLRPAG